MELTKQELEGILDKKLSKLATKDDIKQQTKILSEQIEELARITNTGFDDVLIKIINGEEHFIILESKGNSAALKYIKGVTGTGRIKQMTQEWVEDVLKRMAQTNDPKYLDLSNRLKIALDAGRVEGRICWVRFSGESLDSIAHSFRYYGPKVPKAVRDAYKTMSKR